MADPSMNAYDKLVMLLNPNAGENAGDILKRNITTHLTWLFILFGFVFAVTLIGSLSAAAKVHHISSTTPTIKNETDVVHNMLTAELVVVILFSFAFLICAVQFYGSMKKDLPLLFHRKGSSSIGDSIVKSAMPAMQ
jgi:hypothetical protein